MKVHVLVMIIVFLVLSGCHTSASFVLPPNTDLMLNGERISFNAKDEEGRVKLDRRPFFWTSVVGIEYMLLQDEKVVKKAKLPSAFRISSIFWPPYAYIYWPIGFRFQCYDLSDPTKEFVEKCGLPGKDEKREAQATQAGQ